MTSWYLVETVTLSIVLPKYYRSYFCKSTSNLGYARAGTKSTSEDPPVRSLRSIPVYLLLINLPYGIVTALAAKAIVGK
jgi:hypothetical protein